MAGDPNQAIFFVGYTDPDTPGGKMRAAKHGETFVFSPSGGELTLNCEVDHFDLTAHANRDELLDFVGQVEPRTLVLGHGDDEARAWFAQAVNNRYPKIQVLQPGPGETVEI
jgi:predicted metal-dependent RNase